MLKVQKERQAQGLSQAALARRAEMHQASLSSIETGRFRPYPGQLARIAAALEWQGDAQELLDHVEEDCDGGAS